MNNQYLKQSLWRATYIASPYASSCYIIDKLAECMGELDKKTRNANIRARIEEQVANGEVCLLPHRLQVLQGQTMPATAKKGRAIRPMAGQLKGVYIQAEDSPYKVNKPYQVQTGLWPVADCKTIYQGSIGITGPDGHISKDNGDLVLIKTSDWKTLQVYVFRGLAGVNKQLDYLAECVAYIKTI